MVRVSVGTAIAFMIYHLFSLPQGYWAVFTVVIVMQASIGGTLSASLDRFKGTIVGAVVGGFFAWLHPRTTVGLGAALVVAVALTAFFAALRPSLKVAPVTAVIMIISPSGGALGPLGSALYRVVEILVGSIIGVLATYFVFPARSTALVTAKAAEVLTLIAAVLDGYAADLKAVDVVSGHDGVQLKIRVGLSAVETAMKDADREQSSRLGENRLSEALPRTLWRVRNDCITVSRALGPSPERIATLIQAPLTSLMRGEAGFMRVCAASLTAENRVDRSGREEPRLTFQKAMSELRRSRLTDDLAFRRHRTSVWPGLRP